MTVDPVVKRAPSLFISHGAGPFVILGAEWHKGLRDLSDETQWVLDGVKGIIMVTPHWQTEQPCISSEAKPHLYYDYIEELNDGLPKEAWEITYDATGHPEMARKVKTALEKVGFEPQLNDTRGWDHGVWVPMILMRPQADLPCVQVSVPEGDWHRETENALKLGKALEQFRNEGWAIIGSGSSYHNFEALIGTIMGTEGAKAIPSNRPFEDAMQRVAELPSWDDKITEMRKWRETFPGADDVHVPGKDEHFIPFIVSVAAAGEGPGKKLGEWQLFGTIMSSFMWD